MKYISSRGGEGRVTAKEAIVRGLAPDGGLYVPETMPKLNHSLEELITLAYTDLAHAVLKPFLNFSDEELRECVEKAYAPERFASSLVAPVVTPFEGEKLHFLELFHGPTLAFKDMALSILPHLMKASASEEELLILTATSGDTGKAALEAFKDVEGISIIVFYPENGVSATQKRQMITQEGSNVKVYGVKGNFDDAQSGVKRIFSDSELNKKLAAKGIMFSSANSINIGRLLPQVVYYFYAYGQLVKDSSIKLGDKLNFVVPTGNFGNILAGYYAKELGLPINKLICASNDNKILYDFFKTGTYDKNREFFCTISPSMDILISSNLERLLYHVTDTASVKSMMDALNDSGKYETDVKLPDFYGAYTTEVETKKAIAEAWQKGYLMDTHTAVAYHAGRKYTEETRDNTPQVVISTASPYKFAEDVLAALNVDWQGDTAKALSEKSGLAIPEPIVQLTDKPVLHTEVCAVEKMSDIVSQF